MDEWIRKEYDKHQAERVFEAGSYHISDLAGFGYDISEWCPRQAWYRYKSTTDGAYNRERAGWFQRGRDFELRVAELFLPSIGWEIVASGPISDTDTERFLNHPLGRVGESINLIGHIDILARHPPDPTVYVVEIKSTNFSSHDVFDRFCIEPDWPKASHVLQCNGYSSITSKPWLIIYLSISDFSMRGWVGQPDPLLMDTITQRAWMLHDYLKSDTPPDGRVNWACDFSQATKPRTHCESFNLCRTRGGYGPHPQLFGWCYGCRQAILEFNEKSGRSFLLTEPGTGRLVCPSCGRRVVRKHLNPKNRKFLQKLAGNIPIPDPYEKPL